jgi:Aminoglycoside-2''-adenylyltransferase
MDVQLGKWVPLTIQQTAEVFARAPFRWWVGGGRALELFAGRSWRRQDDIDVGICRQDAVALPQLLPGWNLHLAWRRTLTPWNGEPLRAERNENNIWCRASASSPWSIDISLNEGDERRWVYRRDPSLRLAWDEAVLQTDDGIPYLAPELQLLFKSKEPRPKDEDDARQTIPILPPHRGARLARWLPEAHRWKQLLASRRGDDAPGGS